MQKVEADSFEQLDFISPMYEEDAFLRLYHLYRDFIVRKYAVIFGTVILFHLPADVDVPFTSESERYGKIFDPLTAVTVQFHGHIRLIKGEIVFSDSETASFFELLKKRGALHIVKGKRNHLSFLPVSHSFGFLSKTCPEASCRVNSSFFVMDLFDCATVYDQIGTPIGLSVKNGKILTPPLFDREALIVRGKTVSVDPVGLEKICVTVQGKTYIHKDNAFYYSRPGYRKTPAGGYDVVIVNDRIRAVKAGGRTPIPASGFILHLKEDPQISDCRVVYAGMEDCIFALQVGNSTIINGKKSGKFISSFYHLPDPLTPSYPPSLYPHDYRKARAPRIVLGADKEGRPVILWFEGKGKFGYEKGKESCGASLWEVAGICEKMGIVNGISLDGGGSAQILIGKQRMLKLSDRDPDDLSQIERAIPCGLMIG